MNSETIQTLQSPKRVTRPSRLSHGPGGSVLRQSVYQHDEASAGKGLKYLRSFLSNVVRSPAWAAAKPILHALNGVDPASAVAHARHLLTQTYETHDEHFVAMSIASFVKKYPFVGNNQVAEDNARHKFLRGERRNRHMNALLRRRRLSTYDLGLSLHPSDRLPGFDNRKLVHDCRGYISRVLGQTPRFSEFLPNGAWGPGANVGVSGQFTNFARKLLSDEWTVTPAALPYAITALKRLPMIWELFGMTKVYQDAQGEFVSLVMCIDPELLESRIMGKVRIVDYNSLSYAIKDSDCHRTIAKEPLLNQLVQLATDLEMKTRLCRFGIDLRKQGPNQEMAREGSLDVPNPYCTADLKNASGSIFTELVRELLPPAWFKYLNDIRSPSWRDKGSKQSHKYHGFVSMGNGYCFPLETLIFASICSAAHKYCGTEPDFRVYGDDIIIRQNESGVLQEYLRYFGFELNPEKSYFFGPFRESCGADWHGGQPVRPVYIHTSLESFSERIRAHNALARLPNRWASFLCESTRDWWPPFTSYFVCPFGTHTDEALDGRHNVGPEPNLGWDSITQSPVWYGVSVKPVRDTDIEGHPDYQVALMYAALRSASSEAPFTARRETRTGVARFSHAGGGSDPLPCEDPNFRSKAISRYRSLCNRPN